jgi:hypothetical protein
MRSQRRLDIFASATKTPATKLVAPQMTVKKTVIKSPRDSTPSAEVAL